MKFSRRSRFDVAVVVSKPPLSDNRRRRTRSKKKNSEGARKKKSSSLLSLSLSLCLSLSLGERSFFLFFLCGRVDSLLSPLCARKKIETLNPRKKISYDFSSIFLRGETTTFQFFFFFSLFFRPQKQRKEKPDTYYY